MSDFKAKVHQIWFPVGLREGKGRERERSGGIGKWRKGGRAHDKYEA